MIAARAQKRRSRPYNEIGLGTNENNIKLLIDELQIKRELDIKFLTRQHRKCIVTLESIAVICIVDS
jgi:hypothetical protein